MNIGKIDVKISAVSLTVFGFFTLILLGYVAQSGDYETLVWGVPTLIMLLIIPMALNYMSRHQYAGLLPIYEIEAKNLRIKAINLNMIGQPVRIEGVVEAVHFQYLNRPQYIVADRTGEISVKMFTSPAEKIKKGDVVEVLGQVLRRYLATGDPTINCISIRKIEKSVE